MPRDQPEEVEEARRVGRGEVSDPAVEGRVAHLDGDVEHLVEREEDRDLHDDRQAARQGRNLLLLVELHHGFLLLRAVVGEALLDRHHLGLQLLHLAHGRVGLVGQREEDELHDHGREQDGDAEIADPLLQVVDQPEHRLGDEVEPTPVDHQVEALDARIAVAVDGVDDLGAGEEPALVGGRLAGRHDKRVLAQIVSLEHVVARLMGVAESSRDGLLLVGDGRDAPVLVGDAKPAAGRLNGCRRGVLLQVLVGDLLELAREHPDQTLVDDVHALHVRNALPHHARIRIERHRALRPVLNLLAGGEEIVGIDRDGPLEDEPLAIVPGERHRRAGLQDRTGRDLPDGPGIRRLHPRAGRGHPALLGEVGFLAARGAEQRDGRTARLHGDPVLLEAQVIQMAALEVDRARKARRVDRKPGRGRDDCLARLDGRGSLGGPRKLRRLAGGGLLALLLRGARLVCLLLLLGLLVALLLEHRLGIEILPAGNDQDRQHDREDEVLVVAGHALGAVLVSDWQARRSTAWRTSCLRASKGRASPAARPMKT